MHATEQLAELIRKKHRVLMQLRDVALRQSDFAKSGDIASLLSLLAAKQELIAALQTLERQLTSYYGEDPELRVWRSTTDRAECAQQADECNALLDEIVRLEKLGAEQMTLRRNHVADQLQRVHSATQVRGAYEAQRRSHA